MVNGEGLRVPLFPIPESQLFMPNLFTNRTVQRHLLPFVNIKGQFGFISTEQVEQTNLIALLSCPCHTHTLLPHPSSSRLPDCQLDPQVTVHSDGQQGHNGGVGEDQNHAGHEKAGIEVHLHFQADSNGQRHDQYPDSNVSQCEGDYEIEGGGPQTGVQLDHPDDQHVAHYSAEPDDNLHGDVGDFQPQRCCGVVRCHAVSETLQVCLQDMYGPEDLALAGHLPESPHAAAVENSLFAYSV